MNKEISQKQIPRIIYFLIFSFTIPLYMIIDPNIKRNFDIPDISNRNIITIFISKFTPFNFITIEVNSSKNCTCSFPAYSSPRPLQTLFSYRLLFPLPICLHIYILFCIKFIATTKRTFSQFC